MLQPGAGYEPHADPYDVAILLLSGTVETLDRTLTAPGVIYYCAGEPHGMRNVGQDPARYLVFEFHPGAAAAASLWDQFTHAPPSRNIVETAKQLVARALPRRNLGKKRRQLAIQTRKKFVQAGKHLRKTATRVARVPRRGFVKGRQVAGHRLKSIRNVVRRHGSAGLARRIAGRLGRFILRKPYPSEAQKRTKADKQHRRVLRHARKLQQTGDLAGALAAYDTLPAQRRDQPYILHKRGHLFQLLGQPDAAYDALVKALAADPTQETAWMRMGFVLNELGRREQLPTFIDDMLAALPRTSEVLMQAASIARKARLHDLADELFDTALSPSLNPSAATIFHAAGILLREGDQGRVISLLDREAARGDAKLRNHVLDLRGFALAQLRLASGSNTYARVGSERADVIAVRSILDQWNDRHAGGGSASRGLAIVTDSLGPGGIQKQVVRFLRQLCGGPQRLVPPVRLLLVGRQKLAPEFNKDELTGLDVMVESISGYDVDLREIVAAGVAGQVGVLPSYISTRTAYLVDRLTAHRPEAVLAMAEKNGLAAILAASLTGVPRVTVSLRGEAPRARRFRDSLLRPAYQAALASGRVSLVANSSATARDFAQWLGEAPERVGVVHNGIDVDELLSERDPRATAVHRGALGISDGARVVGSVFNARGEKRPRLWIDAAAIIAERAPDVVFVVVGDGLYRSNISSVLAHYGLEERFHRPGVRKDVATWLDLMDVFLLTSETEGLPNVLLEAQALGCPVVATAVGGTEETFLPENTGVLLPANPTPEEVAAAVMRVLDDPSYAKRSRAQAPAFIRRHFCEKRMTSALLDLCFAMEEVVTDVPRVQLKM